MEPIANPKVLLGETKEIIWSRERFAFAPVCWAQPLAHAGLRQIKAAAKLMPMRRRLRHLPNLANAALRLPTFRSILLFVNFPAGISPVGR